MSTPYRSELCHALDETRVTFKRTTVGISSPLANQCQPEKNDIIAEEDPCDEICDVSHICGAILPCQWIDGRTPETCSAGISCKTISVHFRDSHSIKEIERSAKLSCWWKGCCKWVSRKNFVRHVRETHLGHPRLKDSS